MSTIYDRIKARRLELGLTVEELAQQLGYKDKSSISKIENGKADIPQAKVELFARALRTTTAYLMGVDGPALPPGCEPMPLMCQVPLVGRIACGMPILAEQNIEGMISVPEGWRADFVLTCRGDSMAPLIMDGDLVAVRSQPEVENGEIAVVRIDDEATLKKVNFDGTTMVLQPLNPAYPLMTYTGAALADVHIEGKAVGLCRGL
ncbi:LexA family transcriptional regulator [uncultured Gemmiger sp.]|uniref:LexA family protein n=1 Tax=uncultured Gemmiger sp. TaxID=1623490 RepID=UPI0025D2F014|nr:LexA family transcriptional regulator [uncultured Gemmiger sp.]